MSSKELRFYENESLLRVIILTKGAYLWYLEDYILEANTNYRMEINGRVIFQMTPVIPLYFPFKSFVNNLLCTYDQLEPEDELFIKKYKRVRV